MQMYESRLSYLSDKARINYFKPPSVYQHGGPWRHRRNCHSCIFETKENSNLRICIQYFGHHSKTTCQKSAKSMRYRVRPKFEFNRKSLLIYLLHNKSRVFGSYPGSFMLFHLGKIQLLKVQPKWKVNKEWRTETS